MEEKINVTLYNLGDSYRPEIIYCSHCKECSLYQRGKCLNVTPSTLLTDERRCILGRIEYLRRIPKTEKYYVILQKVFGEDAKRLANVLKHPDDEYLFFKVGEQAYIYTKYITVNRNGNTIEIKDPDFLGYTIVSLDKELYTTEIMEKISSFRPTSIILYEDENEIPEYQGKIVPELLYQIKNEDREFYDRLIAEYPYLADKKPSHIGKYAKLSTVNKKLDYFVNGGVVRFDEKDDRYMVGTVTAYLPFDAEEAEIRFLVTDDMKIEITRKEEVTEDTVFVQF